MTPSAPTFGALDWMRFVTALGLLVFAPLVAVAVLDDRLPAHELPGWFRHLLLAGPAAVACAGVLWPPAWLVCRRSKAAPPTALFALLYTPVLAWQVVGYLDVALDPDPSRVVQVRDVRFERPAKGPSSDVVTSWDDPRDTVALHTTALSPTDRRPNAVVTDTDPRRHAGL